MKNQKIKKISLCVVSLFFILSAHGRLKLVHSANGILTYKNPSGSIRVIKRTQKRALTRPIPTKDLQMIARGRLQALEVLEMGQDTKISRIYPKAIPLKKGRVAYAWSGSYKDRKGKMHFFKEFISQGETWNVFTDKKADLRQADRMVRNLMK